MIELVCQTLDLLARLYLPAIEFGDLADQHVVGRLDRLPWHVDRPASAANRTSCQARRGRPLGHQPSRARIRQTALASAAETTRRVLPPSQRRGVQRPLVRLTECPSSGPTGAQRRRDGGVALRHLWPVDDVPPGVDVGRAGGCRSVGARRGPGRCRATRRGRSGACARARGVALAAAGRSHLDRRGHHHHRGRPASRRQGVRGQGRSA